MFESLTVRGQTFAPALFCAPMAGITHCAFRRLVSDFGGYGALFTEMLSARALLNETFFNSPYVRRRPREGNVFYQLLVGDTDRLAEAMDRISSYEPAGVDVNLACAAREIRRTGAGASLFQDVPRMRRVLTEVRSRFDGPMTAKIRLGAECGEWRASFSERAALIRDCGVDAVILHPRFAGQKFRAHARYEHLAWAASELRLPLIVSGDLRGPADVEARGGALDCVSGVMIGRMAVVQPWIFAGWRGDRPPVDHAEVWMRFWDYVSEDFVPDRRLPRIKMFTEYYSRNFKFGHTLYSLVQSSSSMDEARSRASAFFAEPQSLTASPSTMGIS